MTFHLDPACDHFQWSPNLPLGFFGDTLGLIIAIIPNKHHTATWEPFLSQDGFKNQLLIFGKDRFVSPGT